MPLSKETTDQIRKEADDKYPIQNDNDRPKGSQNDYSEAQQDFDKHNAAMSMMQDAHIEAATAWAVWKEKAEGLRKALEEILELHNNPDNFPMSNYDELNKLLEIATKALEQFK